MKLLDTLERKIGKFAIPNVTLYLVILQSLAYVLMKAQESQGAGNVFMARLMLVGDRVMAGEIWRVFSFLITPPFENPFFAFFALYFFYIMGTALEGFWGAFRYNLYLLIAWFSAIVIAFLLPHVPASNFFIDTSVFLAFAYLYPDFQIYLFFILPIRIKWVALATWVLYAVMLIGGEAMTRLLVLASILNFLLFFGLPLLRRARTGARHMSAQAETLAARNKPFHVCAACGITDKTHPKMDFRYCPDCAGVPAYCEAHIHNHVHLTQPADPAKASEKARE